MSLDEQIARSLESLKGTSSVDPQTICWSSDCGPAVEIDLTAVDSLSCAFRELRVAADELSAMPLEALKSWADRLCERVTYLLEKLGPIEADSEAQTVLVRSTPPAKMAQRTTFYEMLVKAPGVVSLRRYARETAEDRRASIDMQVTHETLLKLVRDVIEAVPTASAT